MLPLVSGSLQVFSTVTLELGRFERLTQGYSQPFAELDQRESGLTPIQGFFRG
jgi:hypothetical protein